MESTATQSIDNLPEHEGKADSPSATNNNSANAISQQHQAPPTAATSMVPNNGALPPLDQQQQQPLPTRPPPGPSMNPLPPYHHHLQQQHHFRVDSQTSSNSFVLKSNPSFYSASGQQQQQQQQFPPYQHYRFPSLESMGASSSQGSGFYPDQQPQQQQLPRINPGAVPPYSSPQQQYPSIGIHNLPYHERRRLYSQRASDTSSNQTLSTVGTPGKESIPPPPPVSVAANTDIPPPPPPLMAAQSPIQQRYPPPPPSSSSYNNQSNPMMMGAHPGGAFGFSPAYHSDSRHMYPPSPGGMHPYDPMGIHHQPPTTTTNIPPPPPPYPWPSGTPGGPMNQNMYGSHSTNNNPFPQPPMYHYRPQHQQSSQTTTDDSSLEDYAYRNQQQPMANGLRMPPRPHSLEQHEFSDDEDSSSSGMDDFGSTSEDSHESILSNTQDPGTSEGENFVDWDQSPLPTERTNLLPPRPSDSTRETVRTKGGRPPPKDMDQQQQQQFYWSTSGNGDSHNTIPTKRSKSSQRNEQVPNQSKSIIDKTTSVWKKLHQRMNWAQALVANLPLTIGGLAYSFACMGVVWFKFAEENLETCVPVHFHSPNCSYPEFPGCFECDTSVYWYNAAYYFHMTCSGIAGILALSFFVKLILAQRVVWDELSNPTTATPAGLICMTLDVVFAGRGLFGELAVVSASTIHLCLAVWFIYMTLVYHIMPQPSWFPNTVGIGLSAVKTWLYFPMAGHFLMAVSLVIDHQCVYFAKQLSFVISQLATFHFRFRFRSIFCSFQ